MIRCMIWHVLGTVVVFKAFSRFERVFEAFCRFERVYSMGPVRSRWFKTNNNNNNEKSATHKNIVTPSLPDHFFLCLAGVRYSLNVHSAGWTVRKRFPRLHQQLHQHQRRWEHGGRAQNRNGFRQSLFVGDDVGGGCFRHQVQSQKDQVCARARARALACVDYILSGTS